MELVPPGPAKLEARLEEIDEPLSVAELGAGHPVEVAMAKQLARRIGGRRRNNTIGFAAIVVVGDENGVVGYGLGKANEVTAAIAKGVEDAKKNLVKIPVINTTIPHEQEAKFGGSRVFMKPAAPGTGVKAGGAMRAVFESVGVQNVLAKSKGSSNPHNLVKATVLALTQMRDAYTVAGLRGVPMNTVFNG
jgi:small subunit ribosomal protein S5